MIYKTIDLSEIAFYNVSEDIAKEFIDKRELMGKRFKLTQGAFKRALKAANKCFVEGITETPDEAIIITIERSWQGVTPEFIKNDVERRRQANERCNGGAKQELIEATTGASRNDW